MPVRDSYNLKSHKYVCIKTYQPDTESNPNPTPNTKQHTIVNIQLNALWVKKQDTLLMSITLQKIIDFQDSVTDRLGTKFSTQ